MKVSVWIITYNHEKFIAQAIESALMQQVNFEYEIVIGEDCSTDKTREIVVDFGNRYPDRIRLLLNEKNLRRRNFTQTMEACRGEYIAMLDGDDYWTSSHKLQKQVDFLDSHRECAICFHSVKMTYEDECIEPIIISPPYKKAKYTLEDLLDYHNFITTLSTMFRNGLFGTFPPWFYTMPVGDFSLHILNSQHGDIGYIDEVMAVYRNHKGGVWNSKNGIQKLQMMIEVMETINKNLNFRYEKRIRCAINHYYYQLATCYANSNDMSHARGILRKCSIESHCTHNKISRLMIAKLLMRIHAPTLYKTIRRLKQISSSV